jgi:hypothetical protein
MLGIYFQLGSPKMAEPMKTKNGILKAAIA